MKKVLIALCLATFALSAPMAMAADVICCKDGKAAPAKTADDCTKGGGKVVKDAKECK